MPIAIRLNEWDPGQAGLSKERATSSWLQILTIDAEASQPHEPSHVRIGPKSINSMMLFDHLDNRN